MENELKVNGSQEFMGVTIPIIEGGFGDDKRIISTRSVSEVHKIELKEINQSVKRLIDKKRLIDNVDYIDLFSNELFKVTASDLGLITSNSQKNVFVLSERGYSKLVKYMDDDKSWEVMDKLIDEYFKMRLNVKNMLSEEDTYILNLYHADTKEDMLMIIKKRENEIVKPLRESLDRYERFLCEKTGMLTKTQLAIKLDTKPQTLAAKLKKAGVYTNTSQISGNFLKKYPDTKIVVECDNTYMVNGVEHSKPDFQWSFLGSKILVDYLLSIGMVTYTDNNGFKLASN